MLPSISLDELVREFKAEYKEKGNRHLLYQVPYLSELARRYQENDDWASLVRAHALYNSCAVRDTTNSEQWLENAYNVQVKYWGTALQSFTQHLQLTRILKSELEDIRSKWKIDTDRIGTLFGRLNCDIDKLASPKNREVYHEILKDTRHVSQQVNHSMIAFTRSIVEKAVGICGVPASRYCVAALGSMARGETTPYSDIEFMFLVDSRSDTMMEYFQRLAVTMYFIISNLGETKLKVMAIPELMTWDSQKEKFTGHWFDDPCMSGFKIDGLGGWAGNIPTGGTPEQSNQFICTVEELAERYKSVFHDPDPEKSLAGDLTAMLTSTAFIYGDPALHEHLRSLLHSYQPNERRKIATLQMLINDLQKFQFHPNIDLTQTRQLKLDIYRYPPILILNLKILHNIQLCDPWEVVSFLESQKIISSQTSQCLRFSLCCALHIRLSAYFYHNSQNDSVSIMSCITEENTYQGAWYVGPELLMHMFIHLMPLKLAAPEVVINPSKQIDVLLTTRSRNEIVVQVRYFSKDYYGAVSLLRAQCAGEWESLTPFYQQAYIYSAIHCGQYLEAEKLLDRRIRGDQYDDFDFFLLGRLNKDQSNYDQALDCYTTRLALLISLYDFTDHKSIAWCYSNIGTALRSLSKYSEALENHKICLAMRLRMYGDSDHAAVADVHCNIGVVLCYQSKYAEALNAHQTSLAMRQRIYGDRDHIEIAAVLGNIAEVYRQQNKCGEALEESRRCLAMRIRLYRNQDHLEIASVLCNIGILLRSQGNHAEAVVEYKRSLGMYRRLFGNGDHIEIAALIGNMGNVLADQGEIAEALDEHIKCLDMRKRIYRGEDHMEIADSLCNIGSCLDILGRYSNALAEYEKGLGMYMRIFGDASHVSIIRVKGNITRVALKMITVSMAEYLL